MRRNATAAEAEKGSFNNYYNSLVELMLKQLYAVCLFFLNSNVSHFKLKERALIPHSPAIVQKIKISENDECFQLVCIPTEKKTN